MSETTTLAPYFAKCKAAAFPMPEPDPVIITTLLFTSILLTKY
ncbi:MAG: Uncharacterised protein [Flavobacterium sp. SCGC AAA160-P02]|nr:MAG: Uncharacterised protein [Flavobacterium sp. SCGC AAA160-P02]